MTLAIETVKLSLKIMIGVTIMGSFRYKLAQFMLGRNGFDMFCRGLLLLSLGLIIVDIIVPGKLLSNLATFVIIYAYFRAFSKNLIRRRAENDWYVNEVELPIRAYLKRDRKNYVYFKCPTCKQLLRAPKGRGKIRVTCSRCTSKFEKKV